jgi:translocation and assembly module TamB
MTGAYPMMLDLDWQTRPSPDARLLGHTRLDGDLTRLDARNTLVGSVDLDLDIEISGLLDRPGWNGTLEIYGLDLPAFDPALPTLELSGALATRGGPDAVELFGDLAGESPEHPAIGRLAGTLDLLWRDRTLHVRGMEIGRGDTGLRVSALGRIAFREATTHIDGFSVRSGRSVLSIDGTLARTLDLRLGLDSPDLASLYPGAVGRVRATGTVTGRTAEPRLTLDLDARNLAVAGQTAAALSAVADLDLAPGGRFELQADGRDLRLGDPGGGTGGDPSRSGGARWQVVSVRGEGSRADHRLGLTLTGEPLSVTLDLSGGLLETGTYRGRLTDLRLESPVFEVWTLRRPSPIDVTWPAITAGPLCLGHGNGSGGCVALARTTPEDWTLGIDLDRLDLGLLAPLLQEGLSLEGVAAFEGRFAAGPVLSGRGSASLPTARLVIARARGQIVDLSGARLDVDSGPAGLRARLALPVRDRGRADADLLLPGWRPEDPSGSAQPLDGRLLVSLDGLEHLGDLIPRISRMSGAVRADIALSGTLGAPDIRGDARIERAGFNVPLLGLDVEDLNLHADAASANRIQVSGGASMGTGRLEIGGNAAFGPEGPEARIHAAGEGLRLIDTSEYVVSVSPRLDLEATATGARLRGEILIPEARIRPRALPEGTVRPSGDVVIKGMDRPPAYPVDLAVELRLGDAVSVDAFGLTGRLAGALSLTRPPGRDLSGNGRLQITDGRYRIPTRFGPATDLLAPLTITRGELVWVMSPIRNPGLLITAQRSAGRTVANLRVLGTLADPRLAFFSDTDPTMTQAQATTFLVTGIPPGGNGGLDTALAFGRYIAPGTFLEYDTGIGATRNRFRLRRNLTDRLQLEASSGGNPAVDLFWTFERD